MRHKTRQFDRNMLPEKIKELTAGQQCNMDEVGLSTSTVIVFEDMVLKMDKYSPEVEATIRIMRWLEGKLPVPKVICHEMKEDISYLLMSKVEGEMSCAEYYLEHPHELTSLLAEGLHMLWSVDVSDCPRVRDLDTELAKAKERLEQGLVDTLDAEPDTYGAEGFANPEELLTWLLEHKPDSEPVLSHGDYCLPNVLLADGRISGFIDLGDAGIADKWKDISLCYRSLKHNFDGTYGGKVYPDFNPDMLFDKLGMEPDWEKLRYYILLDEMF